MLAYLPEPCRQDRNYVTFAIPHLRSPWKPAAAMDVKMRRRSSMGPGRADRPPRTHPRTNPNRKSTSALPAMDRASMLVMEANEIAACLGKDYVFSKVAAIDLGEENTEIKITHQKWKISCIWSLDKLKGRLVRMRKLIYASESDSMECEAVFFDPADTWTRDETGRALSPQQSGALEHSSAMLPVNGLSTGSSTINGSPPKKGENLWIASIPNNKESRSSPKPRAVKRPPKLSLIKPPPGRKSPGFSKNEKVISDDEDYHIVHSPQKAVGNHAKMNGVTDIISCQKAERNGSGHGDMLDYVPQKDTNSPMRTDTMRSTASELPGESLFLMDSTPDTNTADLRAMLPEKYLTDSSGNRATPTHRHPVTSSPPAKRHTTTNSCQTDPTPPTIPALAVCKGFLTATRDRLKSASTPTKMEYVDKILANCEAVKVAVLNVFEGFTQAQETAEEAASFAESTLIKASSLQMAAGMELLSSNCDLWTSSLEELDPPLVAELKHNLSEALFNMADDLVVFLESCESGDETDVAESAGRLVDRVHALCREAGQMALAVGSQSVLLDDPEPSSISELLSLDNNDDDCFNCKAGQDLQQALLDGSDRYLSRAFRCAQETLEECLAFPPLPATDNNALSTIWQCSETVVASCHTLLQQCKKLQDELNGQMHNDSEKPPHYFRYYQMRTHDVNSHIQHLANCSALLCQAKAGLETVSRLALADPDGGTLRKVYRCAEILQRSANKVVAVASCMPPEVNDSEAGSTSSRQSPETCLVKSVVLSDRQYQRIQRQGSDVKTSLDKLLSVVKDNIVQESSSGPVKTRRMLPATPGGKSVVRCQSARCPDRKRASRTLSMIHFGRSNEA